MHGKHTLFRAALWGLLVAIVWGSQPASPQGLSGISAGLTDLSDWVRRGQVLEGQRRWAEALSHYEEALRQFPGDEDLQRRFDSARLHYDLGRRYHDASFRECLVRMSTRETLDLYNEVLLKIQAHHVDAPDFKQLVAHGTSGLEVALGEPAFREAHALRPGSETVEAFHQELQRTLAARQILSRSEACQAVAAVASLARSRLGLQPNAVVMEYACAAASALDPYSTYLTADQLNEVYAQIEGHFVGLGVELKAMDGVLVIVRVIPNSPARRAGLREGDRITAVNGQSTRELCTDHAANLLQGQVGTTVNLTVVSPGGLPRQIGLQRERVEVPSVEDAQILDPAQGVAYLKLACFQKTTCRDLETALWSLHRKGMRSLVIDLRGNPGGLLAAAVDAADMFLYRGVIVTTRGRSVHEDSAYTAREPGTWRVPLVVLIDQDSASAAEIFAGAIHDHHRGTIVGTRSYGKGSVQGIFPLSAAGAGLRLTTARFYSPAGYPYSGKGVEPDVVAREAARPLAGAGPIPADHDPALAAAVQVARQTVAQR